MKPNILTALLISNLLFDNSCSTILSKNFTPKDVAIALYNLKDDKKTKYVPQHNPNSTVYSVTFNDTPYGNLAVIADDKNNDKDVKGDTLEFHLYGSGKEYQDIRYRIYFNKTTSDPNIFIDINEDEISHYDKMIPLDLQGIIDFAYKRILEN